MTRVEGEVVVNGRVAYAPQNPWYEHLSGACTLWLTKRFQRIMSATVRDNILFACHYDEAFYNVVLDGKLSRADTNSTFICSQRVH